MNLKALIEKRNQLIENAETICKKVTDEKRAMNDDETSKYNEVMEEIKKLNETIKAIQETMKLDSKDDGGDNSEGEGKSESSESADVRAMENYIRGIIEKRADVNLTSAANGAIIPTSIANKIIKKVTEICPIYAYATRYNVKGNLEIPYYDETTSTITTAYATEFAELESTSGKFLSIELKGFLAGALSKISKSLINNSQFDVVSFTINAMAESIAVWVENELLNGTSGKIEGLSRVKQSVTTKSATAITADELIKLQDTIPDVYQSDAIWIMSKETRTYIRQLKDGQGNYLLNKDATAKWGYTLFGKDVYVSANMKDISAGATTIFYGDMSGLAVKLSEEVQIEVLREKFATQHAVGVVGWIEIDSKVENTQKIAKLVQKSA